MTEGKVCRSWVVREEWRLAVLGWMLGGARHFSSEFPQLAHVLTRSSENEWKRWRSIVLVLEEYQLFTI